MKAILFILLFCFTGLLLFSQEKAPEKKSFPMFTVSYMPQVPGGDLADRFGINSNIGGSFIYKHKSNLFAEVNGGFIFGGNLKGDAVGLFDSIMTSNGYVINENGEYAKIITAERGFFIGGRLGYIIPVFKNNPNSGIMISVGGGLLQHKIRIDNDANNAPQILYDYKKGYDKLTNGFSATQFIGVVYYGKQQLFNFYAGFEFYQAWTQSRRSYDFNLKAPDTQKRVDLLNGFKVGWIIPIYKRMPDPFYFN
ncbi:MAG: hypothetical protein CVU05_09700 [Bacteroidetes bacterium HGW-Bacteroidetes-21]|jgi:hypothetical protein|nr:MAG: hypothetical protein CVU05_09700 [Bacteroidetes bacterium HGW-Bacteroidetes-21]